MSDPALNFNLPWHQQDAYWIGVYPVGVLPEALARHLEQAGLHSTGDDSMGVRTGRDWKPIWDAIYAALITHKALGGIEVSLTASDKPLRRTDAAVKTPAAIQNIAESMWLGEALIDGRVMCYLQPVMGVNDNVVGYESFARAKAQDGGIIGGDKIMAASKGLGIEYMIDRLLHVKAIKTFVASEFNGFLFVNFLPGFIHRPAVYLEGLGETARSFGIVAKHIVLDFTKSETPRDIEHINNVCNYARSRGYSVALDDISSLDNARKLIPAIRPDFIKIDMQLVRQVDSPDKRDVIRGLVELAHKIGGTVIAEGVETQEAFQALKILGVDMFQGYLFSPPVPVETVMAKSASAS